ncbi:exonuclease [Vibrio parahaemolyticus]|uniref:exonuclease n=1 Tax=Vibrio TaxID=662 RepID=UPI0012997FE8|nr:MULTISPECIES: exonuclease [Vibrio]MDW2264010.1 exonuclease [Vibrio sp. 1557]MRE06444.1 exonuclease [Vibrio parahaemolyticus]
MSKIKKLGLFDLDIFAFQANATAMEEVFLQNGNEYIGLMTNLTQAFDSVVNRIEKLRKELKLDVVIMCLTDDHNWRKDVLPTYKENRKGVRKPVGLQELKQRLSEHYETYIRPSLEADDVMGILATWDKFYPDHRKIIISEDKDMKTLPAWIYNPAKDFEPWFNPIEDADHFHLCQTLAGDTTDGYAGCPSIGMDTASQLLKDRLMFESYEHTFKSGARKGMTEQRWRKVESPSLWDTVVSCFHKAGLNEQAALQQARVARICRASDYDFKNKEVKLWMP